MPSYFHFFSCRMAIRFHISRQLLARGWQETFDQQAACFTDRNLTLNDEIAKHLEHKHLLAQLVAKYCPDMMPLTYTINDENYPQVLAKIIYDHYLIKGQFNENIHGLKWILKPSLLNNGDAIRLFNNVTELKQHYASSKRLGGEHIVQRYLTTPDLIDGRKYTFRLAAVLTNYDGVFLYHQGYINISAHPFTLEDNFENKKAHITNYVLDGEFAHLEQRPTQAIAHFDQIYPQIAQSLKEVLKAILKESPTFLAPGKNKAFEIFGCDFILDDQGKIWLLEINQGPDAPTFEENALDEILWKPFWRDIVEDFVLPIALNKPPKDNYANFKQLLTPSECYSSWRRWWRWLRKGLGRSK